jgi:hypothetical protein
MNENPYSPTKSKLRDGPPAPGSPLKAVLVGFAVDLGGTIAFSIVAALLFGILAGITAAPDGATPDQIAFPSWLTTISSIVGGGFSVLGGFVCARIVQRDEYRWGGVLAACVFVAGMLLGGGSDAPENELLLGLVSVIATMFGAHLGRSRSSRS